MTFNIGDAIKYEDGSGKYLLGEIIDIWKNSSQIITGYFAILDSGEFVHIQPENTKWRKVVFIM
jgi:hypothetical protein